MSKLDASIQLHIVTQLACFKTPSEIQKDLKVNFGVEASTPQIVFYNPETKNGSKELANKWRNIFTATREKYLNDVEAVPIARKAYRMNRLHELARAAKSPVIEASLLEQAAKEMGGVYTNQRDVTSAGQPLKMYVNIDDERI